MDPEPMYPVDATTQDAMVESAPEAEGMNLDDAIAEAVREKRAGGGNRGGRGNLRGDRGGAGPHPERRLKVRAVIVKRGVGPTGGGGGRHGQGGRGYGGGGPPQRKVRDLARGASVNFGTLVAPRTDAPEKSRPFRSIPGACARRAPPPLDTS
jgi:hypothetical protein